MILVTGATGHVGSELVALLTAAGHEVRAMTRRPERLDLPGAEVVGGDAGDPAGLPAACAGVDRAFLMSGEVPGTAPLPTHVPHLVDAAVRAGVRHLVLLSVHSGGAGGDLIADWWRRIERSVTGSGAAWTLLRPGRFMSNALQWAPQIRRGDDVMVPFASRPAASIDPADIAAVAAAALTGEALAGAVLQLSGPQALTPAEELAVLGGLLSRPLRAVEPPLDLVRGGMARGGMPEAAIDAALARTRDTRTGAEVLRTVSGVLGRPAATFTDWAERHLGEFTGPGRPGPAGPAAPDR